MLYLGHVLQLALYGVLSVDPYKGSCGTYTRQNMHSFTCAYIPGQLAAPSLGLCVQACAHVVLFPAVAGMLAVCATWRCYGEADYHAACIGSDS